LDYILLFEGGGRFFVVSDKNKFWSSEPNQKQRLI